MHVFIRLFDKHSIFIYFLYLGKISENIGLGGRYRKEMGGKLGIAPPPVGRRSSFLLLVAVHFLSDFRRRAVSTHVFRNINCLPCFNVANE